MNTIGNLPPILRERFNIYMLDPLLGMMKYIENEVIPLSIKKIRPQDIGKRRKFDELLKEFREVYERKKTEEANYDAKVKEEIKKRPSFSNTGRTFIFKRMEAIKTDTINL
jgi:hypothetical protein